jgi:hypothetical protein
MSEHHEEQIGALAQELLSVTDLTETQITYSPTLKFPKLDFQLSTINDKVEALEDTLQQLQHHKLSIKLLTQNN